MLDTVWVAAHVPKIRDDTIDTLIKAIIRNYELPKEPLYLPTATEPTLLDCSERDNAARLPL